MAMRGRSFGEPLMQRQEPLCAKVAGLDNVLGPRIEERIGMWARAMGAELAEPGCAANATVIMVGRPKGLIDRFRKQRPDRVSPEALRQMRAGQNQRDPAIHGFVADRRNSYGDEMENFAGAEPGGLGAPDIAGDLLFERDARFASNIAIPSPIARTGSLRGVRSPYTQVYPSRRGRRSRRHENSRRPAAGRAVGRAPARDDP
ncbi:MAG: hypothetical protein GVX90_04775, partial [Alphaproteobacteria bacterium]|nr:hypothetical protein [Alphaproteobacteria bacterium]